MRYAKHKITGKVIATQSGDEDLQSFKDSGLGYDESELEIGIATEAQIKEWNEATVTDLEKCIANRKAEYPSIYDYIDGVVKDDQEQINKYIADCQAVKDKYPKE
jgi:hypothetical protein